MLQRFTTVVFCLILLSGCAQYFRSELSPLDQAKLNIKAYRVQLESINNEIQKFNEIASTKNDYEILQKADKYLLEATKLLQIYTKNVMMWEQMDEPPSDIYVNGYNLRNTLKRLVLLLEDISKRKLENSTGGAS